jgi:hypothetical protein
MKISPSLPCTTILITVEPGCALNAEFQDFILRFNNLKNSLLCLREEGIGGENILHLLFIYFDEISHPKHK